MEDIIFKNTERSLYSYYEQKKALFALKFKIERLQNQIKTLEEDIKNNNVHLIDELKGVSYGEAVQGSGFAEGFEKQLCKIIEKKEVELMDKLNILEDLYQKQRDLELDISIIEFYINDLSEEEKKFMKLKYSKKNTLEDIATKLNLSKATIHRLRQKIIKNITGYLEEI